MSTQPLYHTEFRNSPDGRVIRITHFQDGYRLESLNGENMFYEKDGGLKFIKFLPKGEIKEKAYMKLILRIVEFLKNGKLK